MLDIKQIAVSRLVLDNFPHVKSYWQMMTPKIGADILALRGDDIDGTGCRGKRFTTVRRGRPLPKGCSGTYLVRKN